jgi:toxin ParE1/3/4
MIYSFHPEARLEFLDAINFYEYCRDELGLEFSQEIFATIQRIIYFPVAWSEYSLSTRRCLTNRFPYSLIYLIEGEEIFIVAVMHSNRKPGYWKSRIE